MAAFRFMRALNEYEARQYGQALQTLNSVYRALALDGPAETAPSFFNISFAMAAALNGDKAIARQVAGIALRQLANTKKQGFSLNPAEKDYLLYACKWVLSESAGGAETHDFRLAAAIPLTYENLRPDALGTTVRRLFVPDPELGLAFDCWFAETASQFKQRPN